MPTVTSAADEVAFYTGVHHSSARDHTVITGLSLLEGKSVDIYTITSTAILSLPLLKPSCFKMQEIAFNIHKEILFLLSSSSAGCNLYLLVSVAPQTAHLLL